MLVPFGVQALARRLGGGWCVNMPRSPQSKSSRLMISAAPVRGFVTRPGGELEQKRSKAQQSYPAVALLRCGYKIRNAFGWRSSSELLPDSRQSAQILMVRSIVASTDTDDDIVCRVGSAYIDLVEQAIVLKLRGPVNKPILIS